MPNKGLTPSKRSQLGSLDHRLRNDSEEVVLVFEDCYANELVVLIVLLGPTRSVNAELVSRGLIGCSEDDTTTAETSHSSSGQLRRCCTRRGS